MNAANRTQEYNRKMDVSTMVLEAPDSELKLIYDRVRDARVVDVEDGKIWCLDAAAAESLAAEIRAWGLECWALGCAAIFWNPN